MTIKQTDTAQHAPASFVFGKRQVIVADLVQPLTGVVIPTAEQIHNARRVTYTPRVHRELVPIPDPVAEPSPPPLRLSEKPPEDRWIIVVLDKHNTEYVLDDKRYINEQSGYCTPSRNRRTGQPHEIMTYESVGAEYINWPATYARWERRGTRFYTPR